MSVCEVKTSATFRNTGGDGGTQWEIRCPECDDEVIVMEEQYGSTPKCNCGFEWTIGITAIGWKDQ
jgi:hypothetical protein